VEREVMLTGIGGQGVQLAAQVLARAAVADGRNALLFGTYLGAMRGGNTDATVVVADGPVLAPPIISRTWAAVALHHQHWPDLRPKVRREGVVVVDASVFVGEPFADDPAPPAVIELPATDIATALGNEMAASMVMCGALAALTGLVTVDSVVAGMQEALPPYRAQHAPLNETAIRAGADAVTTGDHPAWHEVVA
jgi:Pyruvate/2-oxoacid:ferredoxin oxidoreductase gamma subunit